MKGDRFEKMAHDVYGTPCRTKAEVVLRCAKLLRNEHRAVRMMVKKKPQEYRLTDGTIPPILSMFAADILAALDRRKMKG